MDANGKGRTTRAIRGSILGLAAAWLALPVATTEAAPMRGGGLRGGLAAQEFRVAEAGGIPLPGRWNAFLAGGPATWATRQAPPFTLPVRAALLSLVNGDPTLAAASPLVGYFAWRRALNPLRFDRYHPFIGPLLPQDFRPPLPPPVNPPTVPQIPVDPPVTPPIPSVPPTVPEPSAFLVIALGAAGAIAVRRRSSSRA